MKQELLSIGEVAKMKGVGIKSLRYYERLGVLKPAYTDPESGYRYYSMNQMIDVDLIMSCIELGIPLRELKPYLKVDGSIDVEEMLDYGREIAEDHLHSAEAALAQIDICLEEIQAQQKFAASRDGYQRALGTRYALYLDWEGDTFASKRYVQKMTDIYLYAKKVGLVPLYRQGMLRLPGTGGAWKAYIEASVPKHLEGEWLPAQSILAMEGSTEVYTETTDPAAAPDTIKFAQLPDETMHGHWIVREGFVECFQAVFQESTANDSMLIATEIWNAQLQSDSYVVEVLGR